MTDWIYLGQAPADEPCAQIRQPDYETRAREECQRWRDLLESRFGHDRPETASLRIKREDHDFGSYYEVAIRFDSSCRRALDWAFRVESEAPTRWATP